ncbi:MAG: glgA [Herminiimonas sp.]|nr:glgA [Herminiimonas sp.]
MTSVLHVCSEIYPLLKTGGLADVAGALPPAQIRLGCDARILLPGFPAILAGIAERRLVTQLPARFGAAGISLHAGVLPDSGVPAYVIEAPGLYDRAGNPYADAANQPYPDNYRRFGLLSWMAAQLAQGLDPSWQPDVVHGHDWHAGLAPAYLRAAAAHSGRALAGSVFTVHNLAYQGMFPADTFGGLGLPGAFFDVYGVEFHNQLSFLKAGLFYAGKVTTVSPTYAREIQDPEQGYGLDGLLRSRNEAGDLAGILNGVDPGVWNPATDPAIATPYTSRSVSRKLECKVALQKETGLRVQNDAPLFCVVSRLTDQKGLNLVLAGLPELLRRGGQLVLLGSGDAALEAAFQAAALANPEAVAVQIGYDEEKSHRIIAGGDVVLVPSRFEPCGLTQLYGLRYGTLPLVRRVGGLADTVVDCSLENIGDELATGFVFDAFSEDAFMAALRRAFALYGRKRDWTQVQKRGMKQEFSWDIAAQKYLALYEQVTP